MNKFNPANDDRDDQRLDQLLSEGLLEQGDASRIDRLETFWQSVSNRRIQRQRIAAGAALFSLIVLTLPLLKMRSKQDSKPIDQQVADSIDADSKVEPVEVVKNISDADIEEEFETTPVFHQLVGNAGKRHFSERRRRKKRLEKRNDIRHSLSTSIAENEQLDRTDLLETLKTQFADLEWTLIQFLKTPDLSDAQQELGLELLSTVSSRRALPTFLSYYRASQYVEITAPAIANLATAEQVFQLAIAVNPAATRCVFTNALLRGDSHRLSLFLTLVEQSHTSQMALECLAQMEEPPTPQLFQFLTSPKRRTRLMAALALGQIDDDQAVQQLMQMAMALPTRFPAMVALASSENRSAKQFVQLAQYDIQLADTVRSAQSLVHSVSQNFTEKG